MSGEDAQKWAEELNSPLPGEAVTAAAYEDFDDSYHQIHQ